MSTNNIDIHKADFGYLYGSIKWTVRGSNRTFLLGFGAAQTELRELVVDEWVRVHRGTVEAAIEIAAQLCSSDRHHWTAERFTAVWQGFAAGYEKGKQVGREEGRLRHEEAGA